MENDYKNELAGIRRFNNPELYKKTVEMQKEFAQNGIAWHNPFSDECTPDFCCCTGKGNYDTYFPSFETVVKEHKICQHEFIKKRIDLTTYYQCSKCGEYHY